MKCEKTESIWLEDELNDNEKNYLKEHIKSCSECSREYSNKKAFINIVDDFKERSNQFDLRNMELKPKKKIKRMTKLIPLVAALKKKCPQGDYAISRKAVLKMNKEKFKNKFIRILVEITVIISILVISILMIKQNTKMNNINNSKIINNSENVALQKKSIYTMDINDDAISDAVPNKKEIMLSSGVRNFLNLNLSNDQYIEVKITIYGIDIAFTKSGDYVYEGKTINEWRNDPLVKLYYQYMDEFKTTVKTKPKDYNKKYREFLEERQSQDNNIADIIVSYDKYLLAKSEYEKERKKFVNNVKYVERSEECKRLQSMGLCVELIEIEGSGYYTIIGQLNKKEIISFPTSNKYGYIMRLNNLNKN